MINSAQEFQQLCESVDTEVQHRAANDNAPDEVWFEVLEKYPEMAKWVIHNKTVPLSILRQLAKHSDPRIRWQVAMKRKLDYDIFTVLSQDEEDDVRRQIAYNRKTPRNILELLAYDECTRVAEVARRRLGIEE